ncbi:hypothetical protein SAMN04487772_103108 [[Clostridium] polysaccharolyticum]|uniref:Uncharacterized protein n=1 Tax=[Clostridium] polysaccharolyticum TaxID=29364 RepID=A0A1H9ZB26_9FIRM|nr:hypothetical protein SAMN04487772_103108 [[Clostridium] polysaccharolyticum]
MKQFEMREVESAIYKPWTGDMSPFPGPFPEPFPPIGGLW